MTTLKASETSFIEMTLVPTARCEDCTWTIDYREATVKACRDHVRYHGHTVIREKRTVAKYFPLVEPAK